MFSLTLACAFLACTQSPSTAPDTGPYLVPSAGDISLAYICGNSFRIRNSSPDSVTVRYDVIGPTALGAPDTGRVFLSGGPTGEAYSETYLTTVKKGTLRLFLGNQLLQAKVNGNLPPCTIAADTVRPVFTGAPQYPSPALFAPLPGTDSIGVRRDVVQVLFKSSASGSQIRAFLARIGATVIGGEAPPLGDGSYYLRVPDLGATIDAIESSKAALRGDPVVARVWETSTGGRIKINGLYPNDGGFSRHVDWRKQISVAPVGTNPRLLVNAPLAWGCTNGTESGGGPTIGVIDLDFGATLHPDLSTASQINALPSSTPLVSFPDHADTSLQIQAHALSVAGIIGAVGDNGIGTVGMDWGAPLRLFPVASNGMVVGDVAARFDFAIRSAKAQGVRVLSLSLSPDSGLASRRDIVDRYKAPLSDYLSDPRNLLVVASGNNDITIPVADIRSGTSAVVSAFDRAVAELLVTNQSQIIVVAGSTRDGDLWFHSPGFDGVSRGSTIWVGATDLIAPATFVQSLAPASFPDGLFTQQYGTSYAAPFVAGAAALAMMSGPSLSAGDVKKALLDGSADPRTDNLVPGERAAQDFGSAIGQAHLYHLDAYNTLRRVAMLAGTPLCGDRIWAEGNTVHIGRGSGASEVLPTLPGAIELMLSFHGGRKLAVWDQVTNDVTAFELGSTGQWTSTGPWDWDESGLSGSAVSVWGMIHDQDSTAFVSGNTLWMGHRFDSFDSKITDLKSGGGGNGSGQELCTMEVLRNGNWECDETGFFGTSQSSHWDSDATPTGERSILVQYIVQTVTSTRDAPVDCTNGLPPNENTVCRRYRATGTGSTDRTEIWSVDRQSGAPVELFEIPTRSVGLITGSEDGSGFAIASGIDAGNGFLSACSVQYYKFTASGQATEDGPPYPFASTCSQWDFQGGFSAVRQQLTSAEHPSTKGFALQSRLQRAARK